MENQHRNIKGYRDLTSEEIALMNEGKELAAKVGAFVDKLKKQSYTTMVPGASAGEYVPMQTTADGRWVATGATDLQKGFMALARSVAKPESF